MSIEFSLPSWYISIQLIRAAPLESGYYIQNLHLHKFARTSHISNVACLYDIHKADVIFYIVVQTHKVQRFTVFIMGVGTHHAMQ